MTEYEDLVTPYEFEDRASGFMAEVVKLSESYPDLLVDAENNTLARLEANSWAIKKVKATWEKVFQQGHELETESADHTSVLITIRGQKKKIVLEFAKKVNEIAKGFLGRGENNWSIKDFQDAPDDEFRFFTPLFYEFR